MKWAATALLGAILLGCPARSPEPERPPPAGLLDRTLASCAATPRIAAVVAAGALSVTSSAAELLAERAIGWARVSDDPSARAAVAAAVAERGTRFEPFDVWLREASPAERSEIRASFLEARALLGDARPALSGLDEVYPPRADEVRSAAVKALADRGRIDDLRAHIARFEDRSRRDEAKAALVAALARVGRTDDALAELANIESPAAYGHAERALARADYVRGRRRVALDRARRIESKLIRVEALAELATLAAGAGRAKEASRLFSAAESEAERIDDRFLRAAALTELAVALDRSGRSADARRLLDALSPERAGEVRARRVQELAAAGKLAAARRQAEDLDATGFFASEAESALAVLEAGQRDVDAALARAANIAVPVARWTALGRIVGLAPDLPVTPDRLASIEAALKPYR